MLIWDWMQNANRLQQSAIIMWSIVKRGTLKMELALVEVSIQAGVVLQIAK